MKKFTLLLLIIFSTTYSQTISFPDNNFKAVLLYADTNHYIAKNEAGEFVKIDSNNDSEIQVSEALNIYDLNLYDTNIAITSISIIDMQGIEFFTNLKKLRVPNCLIPDLNLSALINLENLACAGSQFLSTIILPSSGLLQILNANNNNLTSLDLSNQTSLIDCRINNNPITSLDFSNCPNLQTLYCQNTLITNLDVSSNLLLGSILCENIPVETLDFSNNPNLGTIGCGGTTLQTLNVKNGLFNLLNLNGNYPSNNLIYLCCDDNEVAYLLSNYGNIYPNCNINTYCSFNPGGTYYVVSGENKYDGQSDGCDINDVPFSRLKFDISSNSNSGSFYLNSSGFYNLPLSQGNYTISPKLENSNYFTISPNILNVQFPTTTSPFTQNFCLSPIGIHYDLEVSITRLRPQIPGIDVPYKIIFKNKGNQIQSGTITLNFDDAIMDFVSSNPVQVSLVPNQLTWNYTDLEPFETREIDFIMNLNSPMETPALNLGDRIIFSGSIQPTNNAIIDDFPEDNNINANFGVVNSADPNDITCLEGNIVGPDKIGKYVHYMIRFENIGTANATNIVVKNLIDSNKFDITSLIPLYSNYDFVTRKQNNQFEFIFENINLPFDDANNDGYLVYKIKLKNNLVVGDTFINQANIYFDFNFPVITNLESTEISALSSTQFNSDEFAIYPNPTSKILNIDIENSNNFELEIFDLVGKKVAIFKNQKSIDISHLNNGMYLIKVTDLENNTSQSHKIIKR